MAVRETPGATGAAGAAGVPGAAGVTLARIAGVSRAVAATTARSRKTALLAEVFAETETRPEDVPLVISYLSGRLPQGRIGIGWSALKDPPPPAADPVLTVAATDAALTALAGLKGPGSRAARVGLVRELLAAATEEEQRFLTRLLLGEVRQGALDALALEAVAAVAGAPASAVRRAVMMDGSLPRVAGTLFAEGPAALDRFRLTVGTPVLPMLAGTAPSVTEAVRGLGVPCAVEEKLDGVRIQVHRDGGTVRVHTRSLDDITDRLPEVTEAALRIDGDRFVLDGEAIAVGADGRPVPFQELASRVGSRTDVGSARAALPVTPVFFDVLAAGGESTVDLPADERHAVLARLVPGPLRVGRMVVTDPEDARQLAAAEEFLAETLRRGHEGVLVKALDAPYAAGRRGRSWLKVKPVHTLDLVVLAAERGHGRRTGLLSNLHLGARAADGGFVMLGKTFKGLTDETLRWQTRRLGELAVSDDGFTVRVRPELVVEIAYDGVQRSPRYPAGVALRFARVVRYRPDKRAADADTIDTVLAARPPDPSPDPSD